MGYFQEVVTRVRQSLSFAPRLAAGLVRVIGRMVGGIGHTLGEAGSALADAGEQLAIGVGKGTMRREVSIGKLIKARAKAFGALDVNAIVPEKLLVLDRFKTDREYYYTFRVLKEYGDGGAKIWEYGSIYMSDLVSPADAFYYMDQETMDPRYDRGFNYLKWDLVLVRKNLGMMQNVD